MLSCAARPSAKVAPGKADGSCSDRRKMAGYNFLQLLLFTYLHSPNLTAPILLTFLFYLDSALHTIKKMLIASLTI